MGKVAGFFGIGASFSSVSKARLKAALAERGGSGYKTTGINLPADTWELLNRCAFYLAKKFGARPSVSALLVDLVQRHRKELEKELGACQTT